VAIRPRRSMKDHLGTLPRWV